MQGSGRRLSARHDLSSNASFRSENGAFCDRVLVGSHEIFCLNKNMPLAPQVSVGRRRVECRSLWLAPSRTRAGSGRAIHEGLAHRIAHRFSGVAGTGPGTSAGWNKRTSVFDIGCADRSPPSPTTLPGRMASMGSASSHRSATSFAVTPSNDVAVGDAAPGGVRAPRSTRPCRGAGPACARPCSEAER